MKLKLLPILMIFCLLTSGCTAGRPQDDRVYPAERSGNDLMLTASDDPIDTEGIVPFRTDIPAHLENNSRYLNISASPDGNSIYYMTREQGSLGITRGNTGRVIKGRDPYKMDLMRRDIDTGTTELIDSFIPVVTRAEWNTSGNILALMGGNHLTLYDAENRRLLIPDELQNEDITHFGWSPDGEKVYTEHPNLPNGSIIYVDSGSIVHAYENDEGLYYKGKLDDNYSYGTYICRPSEAELKQGINEVPQTVIVDNNNAKVIKVAGEGCFRDAYKRSILQTGDTLFGLYYTPDINRPDQVIQLSEEYIYDARFVYDGKIVYIIQAPEADKNLFLLCIADREGKPITEMELTGNSLVLSPDGKTVFTKGLKEEEIDLSTMSLKTRRFVDSNPETQAFDSAIRGAVNCYCKARLTGVSDEEILTRYFTDTHNPEQWAYFDISTGIKERHAHATETSYIVEDIIVSDNYIYEDRAMTTIVFTAVNALGTGFRESWAAELIKKDNKWQITGLSTFPDSTERKEAKKIAEYFIADENNSALKNKEVKIGQIQFWQLSEPHYALKPENANYCKVYLQVRENGEESIYKLILHKERNDLYWKVNDLIWDRLSGLF